MNHLFRNYKVISRKSVDLNGVLMSNNYAVEEMIINSSFGIINQLTQYVNLQHTKQQLRPWLGVIINMDY